MQHSYIDSSNHEFKHPVCANAAHRCGLRALNPTSQITTNARSSARRAATSRLKLSNTDKQPCGRVCTAVDFSLEASIQPLSNPAALNALLITASMSGRDDTGLS
jgi:hypothetical protein